MQFLNQIQWINSIKRFVSSPQKCYCEGKKYTRFFFYSWRWDTSQDLRLRIELKAIDADLKYK